MCFFFDHSWLLFFNSWTSRLFSLLLLSFVNALKKKQKLKVKTKKNLLSNKTSKVGFLVLNVHLNRTTSLDIFFLLSQQLQKLEKIWHKREVELSKKTKYIRHCEEYWKKPSFTFLSKVWSENVKVHLPLTSLLFSVSFTSYFSSI